MMGNNKICDKLNRRKDYILLACAGSFFLFCMLYNLTHSAPWGDEWTEYWYSQAGIKSGELYQKIISTFQPPLYNFLMHFWLKLSKSVLWFRFFNIVLGVISGTFFYLILKKLCNKYVAMISLVALATCYQWIYCIQECSEYALMLTFLFVAIWAYIECFNDFSYMKFFIFILANVGAIYSQYGSIFVVAPLLLLLFCRTMFSKEGGMKRKIIVFFSYLISLLVFALPLYIFFLKVQMSHNEISSSSISMSIDLCRDLFFTLGRIIGYFFNLNSSDAWIWLGSATTLLLIIVSLYLFIKGQLGWNGRSLIIVLWVSYILHYFLVRLHIYAMVHPNQSNGFYCRYSYFYIPVLAVILPVFFYELIRAKMVFDIKRILVLFEGAGILCLFLSFYSLMGNWEKAKDDQYAKIWIENSGWEEITYLVGTAYFGFSYYITNSDEYQEGYLNNVTTYADKNNIPLKFWIWRTNWGGDSWQIVVDQAYELGYNVTVYDDSGYLGQLAYCEYTGDYEDFSSKNINMSIINTSFDEKGLLHIWISICNEKLYNSEGYRLSYHVLDLDGNTLIRDNDRTDIGTWAMPGSYECFFDSSILDDQQNYIIEIDLVQEGVCWLSDNGLQTIKIKVIDGIVQD